MAMGGSGKQIPRSGGESVGISTAHFQEEDFRPIQENLKRGGVRNKMPP